MGQNSIQYMVDILYEIFEKLGVQISPLALEELAVILHKSMTVRTRYYHSLDHVLNFYDAEDALKSLVALFHDIVYFQADQGISPTIVEVIGKYITYRTSEIYLVEDLPAQERLYYLTLETFGFKPGQKLELNSGLNEFLSALFMNKTFEQLLPEADLIRTTACIEASIPFRGENELGQGPFDLLASRLERINVEYQLGLAESQIRAILKAAVAFANQDVGNFAEEDPGSFLDSTWKLLPETNQALRAQEFYSIRDYRKALTQTAGFLDALDPGLVFHRYEDYPDTESYANLVHQAYKNVEVARQYLEIKLLSITLLEALAEASGGDAPLPLFMGDIPANDANLRRLEDFLPQESASSFADRASLIYKLLKSGRNSETIFDLKNAPLSLFLYCSLPAERIQQLNKLGESMFKGRIQAHEFLSALEDDVLAPVARACAALARTRRETLLSFASERERKPKSGPQGEKHG
jgi:hypothetical protein